MITAALPSNVDVLTAKRSGRTTTGNIMRRSRRAATVERHPDDLPKSGLFAAPIRIATLRALPVEYLDDAARVTFLLEVRDAEDRRCPDFFVAVRVTGPHRTARAEATTDMFGRVQFRMTGPAGTYRIDVDDVAAGGVAWDRDAGLRTCEVAVD
ncbi:MAG: hypothetical protein WD011_00635 [Nitriliruptoraceae bacterium]